MLSRDELNRQYNMLGTQTIDDLYMYSCLILSGFERDRAYELIPTLRNVWLKDENNLTISTLSDMLYEIRDELNDEMTDREILNAMYNGGGQCF